MGYATGLGIFFGAVYLRTRNLWGPVVVHALIDISAKIFVTEDPVAGIASLAVPPEQMLVGIAVFIVFTAIGLYLVRPAKHEEIKALWREDSWHHEVDVYKRQVLYKGHASGAGHHPGQQRFRRPVPGLHGRGTGEPGHPKCQLKRPV